MKGTVKPASGALCSKCSHDNFKNSYNELVGHSIPSCTKCGGMPNRFKVVKVVPGSSGKGVPIDIYRDEKNQFLTKLADALGVIGQINKELENGTYRPQKYIPKEKEDFNFSNFSEKYIKHFEKRSTYPQEHDEYISPGGLRNKINSVKKLREYFKDASIKDIGPDEIIEYHRSFIKNFRTRDLAVQELKTMLRFAVERDRLLTELPHFPRIKRARIKRAEEIPSAEIQAVIINNIQNKQYRDMWTLAASLAKRPCEVRAYIVEDLHFFNKTLRTARHISKGPKGVGDQIIPGRKSIKESEELGVIYDPLVDEDGNEFLFDMLSSYTVGKKKTDFIFSGTFKPFVSEDALNDAWRRSCKELGFQVKPYDGTKHATLTKLLKESGGNYASTKSFSEHTNVTTLQRYAKTRAEDKRGFLDTTRFRKV
jgi:integrase